MTSRAEYRFEVIGPLAILSGVPRSNYMTAFDGRVSERKDGALVVKLSGGIAYCKRGKTEAVTADVMVEGRPVFSVLNHADILWYSAADGLDEKQLDTIARELKTAADLAMSKTYEFWDKLKIKHPEKT